MQAGEVESAVSEVELRLERLRSLYDQYFTGIEKMEPQVVRKDFDRRLEILRKTQIRNTGLRFRFQVVIQRYNTYQTYWLRICRQIENGTYKRDVRRAKARFGSDPPEAMVAANEAARANPEAAQQAEAARDALQQTTAKKEAGGIFELTDGFDLDLSLDDAFAEATAPMVMKSVERAPAPSPAQPPPAPAPAGARALAPPLPPRAMKPPVPTAAASAPAASPAQPSAANPQPAPAARASFASIDEPHFGPSPASAPRPPAPSSPGIERAPVKRIVITRPAALGPNGPAMTPRPPLSAPAASASAPAPAPSVPAIVRPPSPFASPPTPAAPPQAVASTAAPPPAASRPVAPVARVVARPPTSVADANGMPDERVRQIYARYVDTKRANGESTAAVTFDGLAKSLRDSSAKLRDKVGAGKNIDFEVSVKDGKTVLKPIVK